MLDLDSVHTSSKYKRLDILIIYIAQILTKLINRHLFSVNLCCFKRKVKVYYT